MTNLSNYNLILEIDRTVHHRGDAYRVTEVVSENRYLLKKIGGRKKLTVKMDGNSMQEL